MRLCVVLSVSSLFVGCKGKESAPSAPLVVTPTEPPYFKTPFQDESQFIVGEISSDIAGMIYYAHNHQPPDAKTFEVKAVENGGDPGAPAYDVTIHFDAATALQSKVIVSGPIWSENNYKTLTAAVADAVGLSSPASDKTGDTAMLKQLTDGLAETVVRENDKLSQSLQNDFGNPAWHEQAALLLGAFALRENSGHFCDTRLPLCRMAAHQAVARFLAGDHAPDVNGRVGDCISLTLMNDQAAAIDQLKNIATNDADVAVWVRTLQARNSGDFRPLKFSAEAPGIERIGWFWAYSEVNSPVMAWEKMGDAVTQMPDYARIVGEMGYSVQIGNVLLQSWLPQEFQEIAKVYQLSQGRQLQKEELIAALNKLPERCFEAQETGPPRVRVIGWGLWAMQLQHHLCHAISTDFNSLERKLGVPDDAWEFAQQYETNFGGLRYYAFVRRLDCTNEETYHKSTDEGWAFTVEAPQLTPPSWMDYLCGQVSFAAPYRPIANPHCNEWTKYDPPPGTAFEPSVRLDFPSFVGGYGNGGKDRVLKAHELAPFDLVISRYMRRNYYNDSWTYDDAMSIFGPMLPYSGIAGLAVASAQTNQPEAYEKTMLHAAEMEPSLYYQLGNYDWKRGRTNEAIKAYEQGTDKDSDAVQAAEYAKRQIAYYLATGDKEKARQTAEFAGDVYSYDGLEAKAEFLEKTGELNQALEWYDKIQERYGSSADALNFCVRHRKPTGNAYFDKQVAAHLKNWTDTQEQVQLADFKTRPTAGVLLNGDSDTMNKADLHKGDVVVAVRGIRVRDIEEFTVARDMDAAVTIPLIVWQKGRYRQVEVTLSAEHRLGVPIENYHHR